MNLLQARWVGLDVHTDTVSVEGMIPFGPFVRNDAEFSAVQDVCACVRVLCVFLCVQAVCTLYRARVTLKTPTSMQQQVGHAVRLLPQATPQTTAHFRHLSPWHSSSNLFTRC